MDCCHNGPPVSQDAIPRSITISKLQIKNCHKNKKRIVSIVYKSRFYLVLISADGQYESHKFWEVKAGRSKHSCKYWIKKTDRKHRRGKSESGNS